MLLWPCPRRTLLATQLSVSLHVSSDVLDSTLSVGLGVTNKSEIFIDIKLMNNEDCSYFDVSLYSCIHVLASLLDKQVRARVASS